MDANRNQKLYARPESRRLDRFLGNTAWREEWEIARQRRERSFRSFLASQYIQAMTGIGYLPTTFGDMDEMRTERGLSIYYLAFFSKHRLGYKLRSHKRTFWIGLTVGRAIAAGRRPASSGIQSRPLRQRLPNEFRQGPGVEDQSRARRRGSELRPGGRAGERRELLPHHFSTDFPIQMCSGMTPNGKRSGLRRKNRAAREGRFGFERDQWLILAEPLPRHAGENEVTRTGSTSWGTRYLVEGILHSPDERNPWVRAIWILDAGSQAPRLITAYPFKEK